MAEVDRVPAALSERLVTLRREFHRQPELAFEERKTAARIIAELESLGLEYSYEGAGSGVVGRLDGDPLKARCTPVATTRTWQWSWERPICSALIRPASMSASSSSPPRNAAAGPAWCSRPALWRGSQPSSVATSRSTTGWATSWWEWVTPPAACGIRPG